MHLVDGLSTDICIEKNAHSPNRSKKAWKERERGNGLKSAEKEEIFEEDYNFIFDRFVFFIIATAAAAASMKATPKKQKQRGSKRREIKKKLRNEITMSTVDVGMNASASNRFQLNMLESGLHRVCLFVVRRRKKKETHTHTFLHRRSSVHQTRKFF